MKSKISDEEYWEQYEQTDDGGKNHDINMDVKISFRGINNGIIYETIEKEINCNLKSLGIFNSNLKRVIRMIDETLADKATIDGGY